MIDEGIITLSESRDKVNAMKQARNDKVLGLFSKESVEKALDIAKVVVNGAGTVASVVAAISPAPALAPAFAAGAGALSHIIDRCKGLLERENPGVDEICATIGNIGKDVVNGVQQVQAEVYHYPDKNILRANPAKDEELEMGPSLGLAA